MQKKETQGQKHMITSSCTAASAAINNKVQFMQVLVREGETVRFDWSAASCAAAAHVVQWLTTTKQSRN